MATRSTRTEAYPLLTRDTAVLTLRDGLLAGAAGGMAEIFWIWAYGGADGVGVARGIAAAAGISSASPLPGLGIHMGLAVALGVVLVAMWRVISGRRSLRIRLVAFMLAALALVWGLNFLIVLPAFAPASWRNCPIRSA